MKKTYQKPNILVVELRAAKMLAASSLEMGADVNTTTNAAGRGYDDDIEDEDSWW